MRFLSEEEVYDAACPEWMEDEPGARYRYWSDWELERDRELWRQQARTFRPWYRDMELRWKLQIIQNVQRARSAGLEATLTMVEWRRVLELFQGRCAYCGHNRAKCIEHVLPLSRGGGTNAWNVVPACRGCNARKHARTPFEWLPTHRAALFLTKCLELSEKTKTP